MTAAGDILLLAADEVAAELADLTAEQRFVHRRDGYEAIREFASKPYEAVVVSHPWPDFTGLVRGFRRLRSSAKCYALCSPAGEAELRVSGAEALDDYFIYPPRPEELRLILGEEAAGAQPAEGAAVHLQRLQQIVQSEKISLFSPEQVQVVKGYLGQVLELATLEQQQQKLENPHMVKWVW